MPAICEVLLPKILKSNIRWPGRRKPSKDFQCKDVLVVFLKGINIQDLVLDIPSEI